MFGCHNPLKDVVVPGLIAGSPDYTAQSFGNASSPYFNINLINITLFFAGGCQAVSQATLCSSADVLLTRFWLLCSVLGSNAWNAPETLFLLLIHVHSRQMAS
jgi:hypothetical protein